MRGVPLSNFFIKKLLYSSGSENAGDRSGGHKEMVDRSLVITEGETHQRLYKAGVKELIFVTGLYRLLLWIEPPYDIIFLTSCMLLQ